MASRLKQMFKYRGNRVAMVPQPLKPNEYPKTTHTDPIPSKDSLNLNSEELGLFVRTSPILSSLADYLAELNDTDRKTIFGEIESGCLLQHHLGTVSRKSPIKIDRRIVSADEWLMNKGILIEDFISLLHISASSSIATANETEQIIGEGRAAGYLLTKIRNHLYGRNCDIDSSSSKRAVPLLASLDILPISRFNNGSPPKESDDLLTKRQICIEMQIQRQGIQDYEQLLSNMNKRNLFADRGQTKDICLAWATRVFERLSRIQKAAKSSRSTDAANHENRVPGELTNIDPSKWICNLRQTDLRLVSLIAVKAVVNKILCPSNHRHQNSTPRGSQGDFNANASVFRFLKLEASGITPTSQKRYCCPLTNVAIEIGQTLNREMNLSVINHDKDTLSESTLTTGITSTSPVIWSTVDCARLGGWLMNHIVVESLVSANHADVAKELDDEAREDRTLQHHEDDQMDESIMAATRRSIVSSKSITRIPIDGSVESTRVLRATNGVISSERNTIFGSKPILKDLNPDPPTFLVRERTQQSDTNKEKNSILRSADERGAIVRAFYIRAAERAGRLQGELVLRNVAAESLLKANSSVASHVATRLQPLVCKPMPWTSFWDGPYLTHRVPLLRYTGSLLSLGDSLSSTNFRRVMNVMDILGSVPWVINRPVLEALEEAYTSGNLIGAIPRNEDFDVEEQSQTLSNLAVEVESRNGKEERKRRLLIFQENEKLASQRPTFLLKIKSARNFVNVSSGIYSPHNIDFRGRSYPIPPHLNHQGNDVSRSLLMFRDKKRIGNEGWFWMRVHLANLFGLDKLKFEERVKWADDQIDRIRSTAEDPLGNSSWWSGADDPWQFISVIMEMAQALKCERGPENFETGISIHQDGSCNGLQHYAALGRDVWGAHAVNISPSEEVQDVYCVVLDVVIKKMEILTGSRRMLKKPQDDQKSPVTAALLAFNPTFYDLREKAMAKRCLELGVLQRKVVKITIMTICYGVTKMGAQEQVQEKLKEILCRADTEVRQLSGFISKLILSSIDDIFKSAMKLKDWCDSCSKIMNSHGLAVNWVTPVYNMPCRQPYRAEKSKSVSMAAHGDRRSIKISCSNDSMPVSKAKQRMGFPPNFIHSLDSVHMMLTAEMCAQRGIQFAAVHDSFWTHPCDVGVMNECIREAFIELHKENILQNIRKGFMIQLGRAGDLLPDLPELGDLCIETVRGSKYFFD